MTGEGCLLGWDPNQAQTWYDAADLSKGLEKIPIHVAQSDVAMAYFQYMKSSVVYDQARVQPTLESFRPGDYCSCIMECLGVDATCTCQANLEGGVAYKEGGIVMDEYLEQCNTGDTNYCKKGASCVMGDQVCEGHVPRIFLKECNVKCRCRSDCGNRVVQQGMKYQVEVFRTALTGWGIRATEFIPRGAFVFELIGEILTNAEQIVRNFGVVDGQSYSMQLDADWATERKADDNTALCLDSTHFGNVARFLNHRLELATIF
jgi:hypothetical protein